MAPVKVIYKRLNFSLSPPDAEIDEVKSDAVQNLESDSFQSRFHVGGRAAPLRYLGERPYAPPGALLRQCDRLSDLSAAGRNRIRNTLHLYEPGFSRVTGVQGSEVQFAVWQIVGLLFLHESAFHSFPWR